MGFVHLRIIDEWPATSRRYTHKHCAASEPPSPQSPSFIAVLAP